MFPQVGYAGGFDIMYVESRCKELKLFPPGPNGITVKYLMSFISQGKIFIRPIQENLSFEEKLAPKQVTEQQELCKKCYNIIDVFHLRDHLETCNEGNFVGFTQSFH